MADHSSTGPVEVGAAMDYREHERTYAGFLSVAKYGTLFCVSLMIAMAFGFFVGGFFSGALVLILVFIVGAVLLR